MSTIRFFMVISVVTIFVASCGIKSTQNTNAAETPASLTEQGAEAYDYRSVPENAQFTFILSHDGALDNYKQLAAVLLKSIVEANSNGAIGIQIYPNGQLASTVDQRMDGIVQEAVDIVNTTGDVSVYWEPISIFDLPYMLSDDRLAEAVFSDAQFIKELRDGALEATKNARLMMVANSGRWRNFATTKKQIKRVEDITGLKIRTIASKVQQTLTSALGASPTAIPWGENYVALSTGVVDGTKNGIVDIVNAKLHESVKFIVLDGHAYMAGFWWINNKKFQSLSPALQQVFVDAFEAMREFLNQYMKYSESASIEAFVKAGGTIYKPSAQELETFKGASRSVETQFMENVSEETREWLAKYKRVIAKHTKNLATIRSLETN